MEHPKELLDAFAEEIAAVVKELEPIVQNIRTKYSERLTMQSLVKLLIGFMEQQLLLGIKKLQITAKK